MKKALCLLLCWAVALTACLPAAVAAPRDDRLYLLDHISRLEPQDIPPTPQGIRHYLLISMDKWQNNPENPGYNDGLVLLTLDEVTGRVMVTSIIRDMLVIRPDGNPGRINRIVRLYGIQALLDTLNSHLGLRIDKYVLMDWRHIMEIVDAAGGVTVRLTSDEVHYLQNWAVPVGSTQPVLNKPGEYHLNGFAAVIYMRIRKRRASNDLDTQDYGRTFRARNVLSSLGGSLSGLDMPGAQKLLSDILRIWEEPFDKSYTYEGIRNNGIFTFGSPPRNPDTRRASTNLTMMDLMEAFRVAYALRNATVEQFRLPADGAVVPFTYANGSGQLPDYEKNREMLHNFLFEDTFTVAEEGTP